MKKHKRKYTNGSTRLMEVPVKYQQNFLSKMDERTEKYHFLDREFKQIVADLGGETNLSAMERLLAERLVFVSYLIRETETKLANGANGDRSELLEKWIKLNHSIQSIVSKLGVQRRQTGESGLKKYLDEQE